jgi:CRP-like cAMP-binding protein
MGKKSALDLAEKKSERERRKISVHREQLEDFSVFYVTPEEKAGDNVAAYEHVKTFEPEGGEDESYSRLPVRDASQLENGDRVVISQSDVHTITEVTSRQIVTNLGDKFRKSDGVEWGGGEKEITHKLIKKDE